MSVPSAYKNPNAHCILGQGVGLLSPSVLGRVDKSRRIARSQLAKVVKKHFNDMSVNENDAIVQSLYRSQAQGWSRTRSWTRTNV
jgi:Sin3 binding region of histone deacetylase complex subunit SAP30